MTIPDDESESVLLERIHARDPVAFRQVYEQHRVPLYRFCYMALSGDDAAEDAVHETFLKLWHNPPVCESLRGLKAWLYRVARNEVAMLRRRQKWVVRADTDAIAHEETPLSMLAAAETASLLRRGLASIRPEYRDVLLLREFGELSYAEIGRAMGITPKAVERLLARGREALRETLEEMR